jgi:selenocysteine lyase/cysteine desulfurase
LGVLFARRERLEALEVPKLQPAPDAAPQRLETGTLNHEGIVGAGAAVDYLASLARSQDGKAPANRRGRLRSVFESFHQRGSMLLKQLWDGLSGLEDVKLFGPPPAAPRTPTLAFTVNGRPADQVSRYLASRGIFASHGDFYATTVARRLGVGDSGFVRIGCACYTTSDEVDRVIEAVRAVAEGEK